MYSKLDATVTYQVHIRANKNNSPLTVEFTSIFQVFYCTSIVITVCAITTGVCYSVVLGLCSETYLTCVIYRDSPRVCNVHYVLFLVSQTVYVIVSYLAHVQERNLTCVTYRNIPRVFIVYYVLFLASQTVNDIFRKFPTLFIVSHLR